jgi:AmmeMemoRadiSam system protein B
MKRHAAVAGQFYLGDGKGLTDHVQSLLVRGVEKEEVKAAVCPHAGLMYSGPVAGAVYSRIEFPDTFVLVGPNHTGLGSPISIMSKGAWEIPTGDVEIDEKLASSIRKRAPLVAEDPSAHMLEHSLEVQLPFIRHLSETVKIVPISVLHSTLEELRAVGEGIAIAVGEAGYRVALVASTDMSHFVPDGEARRKDHLAIEKVLALDPDGLYSVVRGEDISMCGVLPTVIVLSAALKLGAREARLVKYTTSAEVSGDYQSVVGYAGVVIK